MLESVRLFLTSPQVLAVCNLITFVTLGFGLKSIADAKALTKNLKGIEESLSTRRVGQSPQYADAIAKLVEKAKYTIQITAIFPGVAIYQAPQVWVRIANAIRVKQAEDVKVTLLFATLEQRRDALCRQFALAISDWETWSAMSPNDHDLKHFSREYHSGEPFFSGIQFIDTLLQVQDDIVDNLFCNAVVERTDSFVPVISWIIDVGTEDSEAFFAINNADGQTTGFVTRDQNMVRSFESVRERYRRVDKG